MCDIIANSNLIFLFFLYSFIYYKEFYSFYLLIRYTVHYFGIQGVSFLSSSGSIHPSLAKWAHVRSAPLLLLLAPCPGSALRYSFIYHNDNDKSHSDGTEEHGIHPAFRAYNFIPFFRKIFWHLRWSWRGPQRWFRLRSFFLPLRVPAPILRVKHQAHAQLRHFRFRPPELFRGSAAGCRLSLFSLPGQLPWR